MSLATKELVLRSHFELKTAILKWFPRHMNRGMREMMQTLRKVDCLVEVHDSRIPFDWMREMMQTLRKVDCLVEVHDSRIPLSGRNKDLIRRLSSLKPHILILNKSDLMDIRYQRRIKERFQSEDSNSRCIFVDSLNPNTRVNGFPEILPTIIEVIRDSDRFNREDFNGFNLMVMGIPNVGKSTIINKLRNTNLRVSGKATTTGAIAGVTRSVLERIKINANPPVYLYDTPGVLEPRIDKGLETIMRCAVCATLSDQLIGYKTIADYILYWLNRHNNHRYVKLLGLDTPSDDITEVLVKGSVYLQNIVEHKSLEKGQMVKRPDVEHTAQQFVTAFRKGQLGRVMLDDDLFK
ncbi:unnamed protein product [Oppiella nova]|uniref:G domain-containing protein n=1 Tax=Oppiella nova TaxID=334625 RepID=A0A7R9M648_9ACAR|nr:unnamed protein product [Oppiella nova]CAG2171479.1 unnamed protein product [Oppiella nova]